MAIIVDFLLLPSLLITFAGTDRRDGAAPSLNPVNQAAE